MWAKSQRLLVNSFKWVENTSQFNGDLINSYNEDSKIVMKDLALRLMFNILKNYTTFTIVFPFYQKERKLKKTKTCNQFT